jgi:hypothetical protein
MNKTFISKLVFGASLLGCLGVFTPSGALAQKCWEKLDEATCKENNCQWNTGPRCGRKRGKNDEGPGAKAGCSGFLTKEECEANEMCEGKIIEKSCEWKTGPSCE